jgi:RimJ/RimL family protein N-acetyltransferase
MRHLLGRARTPEESEQFWRPLCEDTVADAVGLGAWVGFRGDDFLGWWELAHDDPGPGSDTERAEIGWRLQRRHWGQGLATEGAEALLTYGFHALRLKQVWPRPWPSTPASAASCASSE